MNTVQSSLFEQMEEALIHRTLEAIPSLLKYDADINQTDSYGNTALILAVICHDTALVRLLLDKGADPEIKNVHGFTALMHAIEKKQADTVRLLIDAGTYISPNYRTYAENRGASDIAQMLQEKLETRRRAAETAARNKISHDAAATKQEALNRKARQRKLRIKAAP